MRFAVAMGEPAAPLVVRRGMPWARGGQERCEAPLHHTILKQERATYAAHTWEDLGGAIAMLCLVSTLAIATEMTCAKDDGKGQCIAATGP